MRKLGVSHKTVFGSSLVALAAGSIAFPLAAPALTVAGMAVLAAYLVTGRKFRNKDRTEKGIFFLGNERDTSKEVWLSASDCLQQSLVLGTSGAGKTETLIGTVFNALATNSGAIYVDGKGDVSLFAKAYALAKQFGREDDLLVLNFMTGNRDLRRSAGGIVSNTMNPFAMGSADQLTQMVVSLMDDAGGDGAMWKGRATAMLIGVLRALTWLRDLDVIDLNVGTIRDYLNLKAIIDLADPKMYPEMPPNIRKSVRSYLTSLPGYHEDKGHRQAQTTLDQHGYLEMQFTKILGSLADVYGHIFFSTASDVDIEDVVLNRRIVIVMLPALEKAGDEIANLGKIVAANLKSFMARNIVTRSVSTTWDGISDDSASLKLATPFHAVLDDSPYYTVDGMSLMMAQARSTGIAYTFGAQDIASMHRLNEMEGSAIIANTANKRFMRQDSMEDDDPESVKYGLDSGLLRTQKPGEMFALRPDRTARVSSFYAYPEGQIDRSRLDMRVSSLVSVINAASDEANPAEVTP